ncbi:cyclin N-terminal domain-containing protein 2 isoform X2 [Erpetoichthys calabaricus]|uniref:cyclin N-terminal domain-containing protein 2 isoform X2 n=1 Tax=Erpetoichthys calabaricus TaxID=27687 RepID=UPI002233F56E|nr:cyclin N-terminal domain-containing protein 2 isoform X2 [Erpetoichthys calabaricus]
MARPGCCDARAAFEGCRKPEEKRAPLKSWGNICHFSNVRPLPPEEDGSSLFSKLDLEKRRKRKMEKCRGADDILMETFAENTWVCRQAEILHAEDRLWYCGLSVNSSLPAMQQVVNDLKEAMQSLGLSFEQEYSWDIFCAMMKRQSHYVFERAELPKGITVEMRALLVDWLIQDSFRCAEETLYLCVHLLNSCLWLSKVNPSTFQLLGMTCLFIACKKEECLLPETTELCFLMENSFSKKQLLKMERKILDTLKFDVSYAQPLHFLYVVATVGRCNQKVIFLAKYFLELTLLDPEYTLYEPAQLAAAALCLSRKLLNKNCCWDEEEAWARAGHLYSFSKIMLTKIQQRMLKAAAQASSLETQATFLKYSIPERLKISSHPAIFHAHPLHEYS